MMEQYFKWHLPGTTRKRTTSKQHHKQDYDQIDDEESVLTREQGLGLISTLDKETGLSLVVLRFFSME
jgi:hypothetical protein